MVDRERVLERIDRLDTYLGELRSILPADFEEYRHIERRRSCERLLQISIECLLDACELLVAGLRLGLPAGEDDVLDRVERTGTLSTEAVGLLRSMKGLRNLLVHEYARVDDRLVFDLARERLGDLEAVAREILATLK